MQTPKTMAIVAILTNRSTFELRTSKSHQNHKSFTHTEQINKQLLGTQTTQVEKWISIQHLVKGKGKGSL